MIFHNFCHFYFIFLVSHSDTLLIVLVRNVCIDYLYIFLDDKNCISCFVQICKVVPKYCYPFIFGCNNFVYRNYTLYVISVNLLLHFSFFVCLYFLSISWHHVNSNHYFLLLFSDFTLYTWNFNSTKSKFHFKCEINDKDISNFFLAPCID